MIIRETEQAKFRNHSQQRQQSYWQFIIISVNIDFTNQLHKYTVLISLSLAKFDWNRSKSIKVDNHKKFCDRLLSTSDICQLISIEFDQQRSTFIDYRSYRHVTSWIAITISWITIIIKITISSLVIGLKMSYFPLIRLPSCCRTVCYWIVCYWTVCYRTVQ